MNKIRITQCTGNRWYAHLVGQVVPYERFEEDRFEYQGLPGDVYWVREGGHFNPISYVLACDAELVTRDTPDGDEESSKRIDSLTPLDECCRLSHEVDRLNAAVSALQAKEAARLNELKELQAAQRRTNAERDRWKVCARYLGDVLRRESRTEADRKTALEELQRLEDAR